MTLKISGVLSFPKPFPLTKKTGFVSNSAALPSVEAFEPAYLANFEAYVAENHRNDIWHTNFNGSTTSRPLIKKKEEGRGKHVVKQARRPLRSLVRTF